jgi:hypothetical protein
VIPMIGNFNITSASIPVGTYSLTKREFTVIPSSPRARQDRRSFYITKCTPRFLHSTTPRHYQIQLTSAFTSNLYISILPQAHSYGLQPIPHSRATQACLHQCS